MPAKEAKNYLDEQPDLNEVLLSWKSPSHPFKKRNKMFYQTVAAITLLCILIVFFLHEFLLIGVILSIAFVVYVISTVPPVEVEHKITPLGFENAGRLFRWMELYAFWFDERWGEKLLVIQTRLPFFPQVRVVINKNFQEKVKEIVGKHLLFLEKPPRTFVDRASDWLSKNIPLETTS